MVSDVVVTAHAEQEGEGGIGIEIEGEGQQQCHADDAAEPWNDTQRQPDQHAPDEIRHAHGFGDQGRGLPRRV